MKVAVGNSKVDNDVDVAVEEHSQAAEPADCSVIDEVVGAAALLEEACNGYDVLVVVTLLLERAAC